MKRRRLIISVCSILAIAGVLYYLYGGGRVPGGQRPLVSITSSNFADLERDFNQAQGATRLFVLVAPT
jgi:hypothetical protein